jgi:hypothetical protein
MSEMFKVHLFIILENLKSQYHGFLPDISGAAIVKLHQSDTNRKKATSANSLGGEGQIQQPVRLAGG